jgi:Arc/MetJ-type ribon-helix-helix transcriptional regulator
MNRTEGTYSERVGARVSPELKESLRELVSAGVIDSEADAVREALWQYVEQSAGQALRHGDGEVTHRPGSDARMGFDRGDSETRVEWLMSALFVLVALVGSHILNALRREQISPAELADDALQETIYNHRILRKKLAAARRAAEQAEMK